MSLTQWAATGMLMAVWAAPPLPSPQQGSCVPPGDAADQAASAPFTRLAPGDVWPLSRGAGITVAVLDSGVSARAAGMNGSVVRAGVDVFTGRPADTDCVGRGTALAAVIAARPVDGSALTGVAPAVRILPVRVMDAKGKVPPDKLAAGLRAAVDRGAQVALIAGGTAPSTALRGAVRYAAEHNVVVVAAVAAGAELYPASDPSVLAVGGLDHTGAPTEVTGPRVRVDLSVPAEGVISEGPAGPGSYTVNGAGVAAAYVAGAAALVRAYRPQLTAGQIRGRLIGTAIPLAGTRAERRELNLYAAVTAINENAPLPAMGTRAIWPAVPPKPGVPDGTRIAAIATSGAAVATAAGFLAVAAMRARRRRAVAAVGAGPSPDRP